MDEQLLIGESPLAGPGRPAGGGWRGAVFLLALLAGLAGITFLVLVVAPSAGAAGGCGGG